MLLTPDSTNRQNLNISNLKHSRNGHSIFPFVSILIPCRNEEKFIENCLESIINNNEHLMGRLEVLVIDGMSEDGTREIVKGYVDKYPWLKLIDNPKKIVPTAMNIGIKNAQGDIIMRMDAHNIYEKDYISKCVRYLEEYNVDNVGGIWITMPGEDTVIARSIALALSSPFGVGNTYFRIGSKAPKFVDTVPFGCYKREVFEKIGFFDEDLIRNQDDEFNQRLIKNGGKILLAPDIISYYYARDALSKLWRMYYQYGYFKPLVAKKVGGIFTWRQLIPAVFISSVIFFGISSFFFKSLFSIFLFLITSYLIVNFSFSFKIAVKKGFKYFFTLPVIFAVLHFSYGYGYLKGILDFVIFRKHLRKDITNVPLTR